MFERSTRKTAIALIFLTAVLVSVAFARSQPIWGPFFALLIAFGWSVGEIREVTWSAPAGLIAFSAAALLTVPTTEGATWGIIIISSALTAWNVTLMDRLIGNTNNVPHEKQLLRQYYRRLIIVVLAGAVLALSATSINLDISFGFALLLAILAVIGLSQAFIFLRRESD